MLRNVVMGRLRDGEDPARLDEALAAVAALDLPDLVSMHVGRDLRLREGGWDFAITNDWVDADAYRRDDLDDEHNRVRRELFGPICEQVVRVQIALPDA